METLCQTEPESLDFCHLFVTERTKLEEKLPQLKPLLKKTGLIWISWPKGKSKIPTDVNREIIREVGLDIGLVDVKVCAVDKDWSGLKFVYRTKDRYKRLPPPSPKATFFGLSSASRKHSLCFLLLALYYLTLHLRPRPYWYYWSISTIGSLATKQIDQS